MQLTDYQRDMLEGSHGKGTAIAMEILVGIGECFNAKRLVPITRAHVALSAQDADVWFAEKLVGVGAKCAVPPTVNPGYSMSCFAESADDPSDNMRRTHEAYKELGAILSYSCTPYLFDNIPRYGEITAFSETSATIYVNSVLGAKTNREGANSALCAAITGFAPEYGMLLDENRYGTVLVEVKTKLESDFDFSLLGLTGKKIGGGIPVFTGISPNISTESLINLGAQLNVSGSYERFLIVGATPDAKDLETAFGGKKPARNITITGQDIENALLQYSVSGNEKAGFVMLGCPHYTYAQVAKAAELLKGRRALIPVFILTSAAVRELAGKMQLLQELERLGCSIIEDTCVDEKYCFGYLSGQTGLTDSPKCSYYTKTFGLDMRVMDLPSCIEAAVHGGNV